MTEDDGRKALEAYVARWQRAAVQLQKVRDADIRSADTPEAMRIFRGSATWAIDHRPAEAGSGLVDQQRWFQQVRVR